MKKKIIFSAILVIFIILIIVIINAVNSKTQTLQSNNTATNQMVSTSTETENKVDSNSSKEKLVLKENFFITQINDIYYNIEDYIGREIEVEGFPMSSESYTFVGRYGPGCCVGDGYAYIEYEYDEKLSLVDEEDWIKVIGTIQQGNDGTTDYIYIDATSVEKMSERGVDTVAN